MKQRLYPLAVAAALAACAGPATADDFYAGKQISFIVGAGVGGGYDLQARTVARHLVQINAKLGVSTRTAAVRAGMERGLLSTTETDLTY